VRDARLAQVLEHLVRDELTIVLLPDCPLHQRLALACIGEVDERRFVRTRGRAVAAVDELLGLAALGLACD
jgi:hypothetical protein